MAIHPQELKWYKSLEVSDIFSNGGARSDILVVNDVKNNIFRDITEDDIAAETTLHRKLFLYLENDDNIPMSNPKYYLSIPSTGQEDIVFFEGSSTLTQGNITGSERLYGGIYTDAPITAEDTVITGIEELKTSVSLQTGDSIAVVGNGVVEFHDNVTIGILAGQVTVTLDTGDYFHRDYPQGSVISSIYSTAKLDGTISNVNIQGPGTFDQNFLELDFLATVEAVEWTFTIGSDNESFSCTSSEGVFSGSTTLDFAPINVNRGDRPYFIIRSGAWSGFSELDTLRFTTHQPVVPFWLSAYTELGMGAVAVSEFGIGISGA